MSTDAIPTPTVGAAVDPATGNVMLWVAPPGRLGHIFPLDSDAARAWGQQIIAAAEAAAQLSNRPS